MAMLILLQSKKRKMAVGSRSGVSALEELTRVLLCLTSGARDGLVRAW